MYLQFTALFYIEMSSVVKNNFDERRASPYCTQNKSGKARSHLADLKTDLSPPWWLREVLWSRREVGKIGDGSWKVRRGQWTWSKCPRLFPIVLNCSKRIVSKGRALSGNEPRRPLQPITHDWITSTLRPINDFTLLSTSTQRPLTTYPVLHGNKLRPTVTYTQPTSL